VLIHKAITPVALLRLAAYRVISFARRIAGSISARGVFSTLDESPNHGHPATDRRGLERTSNSIQARQPQLL